MQKYPGSLLDGFTQTEVSTLAVKNNLLVAGGFQGELICKYLDRPGICYCTRTTHGDNAITNAVEIYTSRSGGIHFIASNNDCGVRDFDVETFKSKHIYFPWPVNHTSLCPNTKLLVIVGDDPDGMLVDSSSGKIIAHLRGHKDYSFASAWHPDGITFATGNQDKTFFFSFPCSKDLILVKLNMFFQTSAQSPPLVRFTVYFNCCLKLIRVSEGKQKESCNNPLPIMRATGIEPSFFGLGPDSNSNNTSIIVAVHDGFPVRTAIFRRLVGCGREEEEERVKGKVRRREKEND
ncbi:uncharacterized protein LOC111392301 [Olea europaea var. sylvestris]|uniref:uncharacterized protein LOC111392301 n=1 Tax=Olea europaea var. sylvestris TaxID=158386 RepID=UPI000C1CF071|nr:uncharacterized protein LOC111392301 [Olea europaea var. sylvestris]